MLRGAGHPVPQLQDLLQHLQLLGEGEAGRGAGCRSPGRSQRPLVLMRVAPVQRKPDLGHAVAAERGVGFQRLGERPFGPDALAGQQVLLDGLPDQVMPEVVAPGVGDHHAGGDRGPQRGGQRRIIEPGHRGQQRVADAGAA